MSSLCLTGQLKWLSGHSQFHDGIAMFLVTIRSHCLAFKAAFLTTGVQVCIRQRVSASTWTWQVHPVDGGRLSRSSWQERGPIDYRQGWSDQRKPDITSKRAEANKTTGRQTFDWDLSFPNSVYFFRRASVFLFVCSPSTH